jgi:hypothetical protein
MSSAFAIEDMSDLAGTFCFAPLRLFAPTDVGANLIATDNLLFGYCDRFFLDFRHFSGFLGSKKGAIGSNVHLS